MGKGVTTFQASWKTRYPWVSKSNDPQKAFCLWCERDFKISNQGQAALKSHAESKTHTNEVSSRTGQRRLSTTEDKKVEVSKAGELQPILGTSNMID